MSTGCSDWGETAVREAFADWLWVPEGAVEHEVPGGRVVLYPSWVGNRVQVVATPPPGAEEAVAATAERVARDAQEGAWRWHVPSGPDAERLTSVLLRRGAAVDETLDRLALVLADRDRPASGPPTAADGTPYDVRVARGAVDLAGTAAVDADVFSMPAADPDRLDELVGEVEAEWATRSGARVGAWHDGGCVASGGMAVVGEVARLYGGGTRAEHRRRGVYGALLDLRLDLAAEWGASLALVKGRVETSAPILRARGFVEHGREVTYRVPLTPGR